MTFPGNVLACENFSMQERARDKEVKGYEGSNEISGLLYVGVVDSEIHDDFSSRLS